MKPYILITYAIIAFAALPLLAGCATSKDMERVEREVASVGADVRALRAVIDEMDVSVKVEVKRGKQAVDDLKALQEGQARSTDALTALTSELAVVKRNQADLGSRMFSMAGGEITGFAGKLDEVRHDIENTNAKLDALKAALLQRLAAVEEAASKACVPQAGAAAEAEGQAAAGEGAGAPLGDPTEIYQAAYQDYTKGNYEVAILGFKEYLKSFPDAEFAGNSQYWIGESLYSLNRYEESEAEFDKVINGYPESSKVPDAMLKKGYCLDALDMGKEAKAVYEQIIKKYANSSAARLAEERLKPKTRGKVPGK